VELTDVQKRARAAIAKMDEAALKAKMTAPVETPKQDGEKQ
jgi:hypothetical protein